MKFGRTKFNFVLPCADDKKEGKRSPAMSQSVLPASSGHSFKAKSTGLLQYFLMKGRTITSFGIPDITESLDLFESASQDLMTSAGTSLESVAGTSRQPESSNDAILSTTYGSNYIIKAVQDLSSGLKEFRQQGIIFFSVRGRIEFCPASLGEFIFILSSLNKVLFVDRVACL